VEKNIRLLIVEDDPVQRMLIERILEKSLDWLQFKSESSLASAQAALYHDEFDIIVSDYILPDGKGTDLLDKEKYPLIVMTSQGSQQIAAEIMKAGAHDYLVKSQELFNEFPHIIQRAMREWDLQRQNEDIRNILNNSDNVCVFLFNKHPDIMFITDENDKIIMINNEARKQFSLKDETGTKIASLFTLPEGFFTELAEKPGTWKKEKLGKLDFQISVHVFSTEDKASIQYKVYILRGI
jgi:DNA-binding NarL/FixJ family response regulator